MGKSKRLKRDPAQNETTVNQGINSDSGTNQTIALDSEQRVHALSPSMFVYKRYIGNKLAIIGTVIIIAMFLFTFVGGYISPYDESQVFMGYEVMSKHYASVTQNKDYRYTVVEGKEFTSVARAELILAINKDKTEFTTMNQTYALTKEGEKFYRISLKEKIATATTIRGITTINAEDGFEFSKELESAFETAIKEGRDSFELKGITYFLSGNAKETHLSTQEDVVLASMMIFDVFSRGTELSFDFKRMAEKAINENQAKFMADQILYEIEMKEGNAIIYSNIDGVCTEYAQVSDLVVQPIENGMFLDVVFKSLVQEAFVNGDSSFTHINEVGEEVIYTITRKNDQHMVCVDVETQVIKIYDEPSSSHWLGTDANGMDILTRLMYGGRISLIIGFLIVAIQVTLGIILGGVAGYFGKWVDNLIMRIADIFYYIPSLPLIIIIGSVMDKMKVDPQVRIYFIMLILGFLGWPGIARMVRGQILSLREQEFMTSTKAMGISIPRRIFKHLIPNIIPQLIAMSAMGLGSIIITESTLSFLGLGVKFPFASWGNMISAVSNVYVMTNYWFVWIPAGLCILLTVLAFTFIGDGLRDAFDP